MLAVGGSMSKRKSHFTIATGADRPKLSGAQLLQAAQEANLFAAELQQQAQIQLTAEATAKPTIDSRLEAALTGLGVPGGAQLSKSSTMRLRGLVEIVAGEE